MEVEKLAVFAVLCSVLIVILRNSRPEQGVILSIFAAALLMFWLMGDIVPLLEEMQSMTARFHFQEERWQILLKTLGICLLTQTAGDLCRDAGEASLAGKVELAGKTAILLLCLPMFRELLHTAVNLIG